MRNANALRAANLPALPLTVTRAIEVVNVTLREIRFISLAS